MKVAPTVELVMADDGSHLRLVQGSVRGKQIKGHEVLKGTDFTKGLFVDALLGNWDVIGNAPQYNVFVGKGGKVSRIDTGGLDFRAQGARKPSGAFGDVVQELGGFAGLGGGGKPGRKTYEVFSKMNEKDYHKAAKVFKKIPWSKVLGAVNSVDSELQDLEAEAHGFHGFHGWSRVKTQKYLDDMAKILKKRHQHVSTVISELGL